MLSKDGLKTVLAAWNFWNTQAPPSIPRRILKKKWDWDPELILVIQGVRRCGKSTLLTQIMTQKKIRPTACYFINFEDPRLSEDLTPKLLDTLVALAKAENKENTPLYFFLDEIQVVDDWEKWLHKQVERPSTNHFVVTGSNATLLGGRMSTALTGRHRTMELFPFDYLEYKMAVREGSFEDYLTHGGFPKVLRVSEKDELLREYFIDIIERDVRRHVSTRVPQTLLLIAKAVFESMATEMSLRKLARLFGSTADTVGTFVEALCASYLIMECPFFTFSQRKSLVRPSKYFPIDTGLHRSVITRSGADREKYLETIVFHLLKKRFRTVSYWRAKHEVDFVVQDGNSVLPIQVTWEGIKERHLLALKEFHREFPQAENGVCITRNNIEEVLRHETFANHLFTRL
ncbi:MAG: ATP-binding protein [Deltaproteobacteria bacterium]|nr:ATP-binding protein [Deltaproteobacteria bacterium]